MEQEIIETIIDFFKNNERQGPGSNDATIRALNFVDDYENFKNILDVGCGTGSQTFALAQKTNANIFAVDLLPGFLKVLDERATSSGLQDRITTREANMDNLPFDSETFNMIWSEGAIYHIGFEKGLLQWNRFLKEGGYLVVSELSWITNRRPQEVTDYWMLNYPEIDLISNKMKTIEQSGYLPIGCFTLPSSAWDNYYHPVIKKVASSIGKQSNDSPMASFLDRVVEEIFIYQKYGRFYNYAFYIMKKPYGSY
ncbi:class I SAM-dependent methyltransferase [Olivibacter domesticus]|uniref:Methyltransferase domain-containing protein n=1 Tax=Olivibacter domesticus TaxID=407022 RepID=A0A1H7QX89_OLID1|nr:class I SAM-dependent methyltransferase [Olivibacter domesticus]SEL52621.1 Methyltransferase domain-containing protein [Olivibacter domesticus]